MNWVNDFDLFLFDFDGLLVNTELLHYAAYKKMCYDRGFDLSWNFNQYIEIAHYSSQGLSESIYSEFPKLKEMEKDWNVLYKEKKEALIQMYQEQTISLMPGVEDFLDRILVEKKKIAVVTNSDYQLVNLLKGKNKILNRISHWITREMYLHAKPDSECYNYAINLLATSSDSIIGFEDTPRGIYALLGTRATPVLVTSMSYPEIPKLKEKGVYYFFSFEEILNSNGHNLLIGNKS